MTRPRDNRDGDSTAGSRSGGGIVSGAGDRSGAVQAEGLRAVRRRWATGVAVVTTTGGDGFRGATVTAFTPVSLAPPLVLVCLERTSRTAELIRTSGVFAVSLLDRSQEFLAERFAARAPLADARFTGIRHTLAANGCPVLTGALAWVACRVTAVHDGGDHDIVVGEVKDSWIGPDTDDPLLSYEGRYRAIEGG
jgi:flavin reductase (DIM6/NTAB) family NADH-FMN oxidoreductase RutF